MYTPPYFAETDLARMHDAIERYSFATLVSPSEVELVASHLPLLIDRTSGPRGTLLGHMARANLQWESAAGTPVLAIFTGPHAYISPTWYADDKTVPTWNYVAVHAYGRLELIEDASQTIALLERTVDRYEAAFPQPWRLADQPADFVERLAQQIVAFQIPLDRLEGKWKLNQNHPADRRARVVAQLQQSASEDSQAIARLMREDQQSHGS